MSSAVPIPAGPVEIVYKGNIIAVIRQPMQIGDKIRTFEKAVRSPGSRSIIISLDEKILITKEYRNEIKDWDYRLPGGKVCDTLDEYLTLASSPEKILEASRRGEVKEVLEEAGIEARNISLFCAVGAGGNTVTWDLYYYIIDNFVQHPKQQLGEEEDISVAWYGIPQVAELCLSGKMKEERSASVLLRYLHTISKI